MKKNVLLALWGVLWTVCCGIGLIRTVLLPEPEGMVRHLMTLAAVACFVPPALLVRSGGARMLALVRNLSLCSLSLTVVLIIANFLSYAAPETLGNILYYMLVIVSSPMICGGRWVLSLFLWACLLVASQKKLKK